MKIIHKKNIFFLFSLSVFTLTSNTMHCMKRKKNAINAIDAIVITSSKKNDFQKNKSNSSTEEYSWPEEFFEEKSSIEDFSIGEPPQKKRKIDIFEEKSSQEQKEYINPHFDEKLYTCYCCHKEFKRQNTLYKHIQTKHTEHKKYYCDHTSCNKIFETKSGLITHTQVQHENIRYTCPQCNKIYKNKYILKKHIENNHKNKIKNILIKHINIKYTENKMHCCDYTNCNKIFETKSGLNKHIQIKHENIRYNCSQCNKNYTSRENLDQHMKNRHKK